MYSHHYKNAIFLPLQTYAISAIVMIMAHGTNSFTRAVSICSCDYTTFDDVSHRDRHEQGRQERRPAGRAPEGGRRK